MNSINSLWKQICLSVLVVLLQGNAHAGVSELNGSFNVAFTDVKLNADSCQPIGQRIYNSKNGKKGIFGWGWSTNLESRLTAHTDGTVSIFEHGSVRRFGTPPLAEDDTRSITDRLVLAASSIEGSVASANEQTYREKILSDPEFRDREWSRLGAAGRLPPSPLPVGRRVSSGCSDKQFITRFRNGYLREFCDRRAQYFDLNGRLVRVQDAEGNYVLLTYDQSGRLSQLDNDKNITVRFVYNTAGLVAQLKPSNGSPLEYRYNPFGELTYTSDSQEETTYIYDPAGRHNLSEIRYADSSAQKIEYFDAEHQENVHIVKDREGFVTEYAYQVDPADPEHLTVTWTRNDPSSERTAVGTNEYFTRRTGNEERIILRAIETDRNERRETIYSDNGVYPLQILTNDGETRFQYDEQWRVVERESPYEIARYTYHPRYGKISSVTKAQKDVHEDVQYNYEYGDRQQLIRASSSDGRQVVLRYNDQNQIEEVTNVATNTAIRVKYSRDARIASMESGKEGKVTVTYGADGAIKSVRASNGRRSALRITALFQALMDLVQPASISFGF